MSTAFFLGASGHGKEVAFRSNSGVVTWKVTRDQMYSCPCCGVILANDQAVFMDEYGKTFTRDELVAESGEPNV